MGVGVRGAAVQVDQDPAGVLGAVITTDYNPALVPLRLRLMVARSARAVPNNPVTPVASLVETPVRRLQ